MTAPLPRDTNLGGVPMKRNPNKEINPAREEFAVGFFTGLSIIGGIALIFLAWFWF